MLLFLLNLFHVRYGFKTRYTATVIGQEVGVILVGNMFNTLIFCILAFFALGLQKLIERAPKLVYKIVSSYGIATVFDFILVGILDVITWV